MQNEVSPKKAVKGNNMRLCNVFLMVMALLIFSPAAFSADSVSGKAGTESGNPINNPVMKAHLAAQEALRELVDAYNAKDVGRFMSFVAEDYAGDDMMLDTKIRKKFSKVFDMQVRYTLNNITSDSRNEKVSVSVTYTKSYTDIKTTKRINKTGTAELIFKIVDESAKLYAMKRSSMF